MRGPQEKPQLFHEALRDFLNTLDVSMETIAPFAGLHPQQLRRLGKDGRHHTLARRSIDSLIEAAGLVGRQPTPELQAAWEKHLKVSSLYTVLVVASHRRTNSTWPKMPKDYEFVWEAAENLALYSRFRIYHTDSGSYQYRDDGFNWDALPLKERWSKLGIETEENIAAVLEENDKPERRKPQRPET